MRPVRAAPPSPGQRPGYVLVIKKRPVRAKALKYQRFIKLLPLQGDLFTSMITQGVALG